MSCSIWPPLRQGIKFWNGQYNIFKNTTYLKKRNALPNFKNILETFFATNHCDQKRSILHLLQGGGVEVVISYVTGLFQFEGKPEIFYLNPPSPLLKGGPFLATQLYYGTLASFSAVVSLILKLLSNSFHFLFLYSARLLAGLFWGRVVGCQKCCEESDIWLPYCHRNMICEMRMSHWIRPWNHVSGPYQEKIDSDINLQKTRRAFSTFSAKSDKFLVGRYLLFVTIFCCQQKQHFQTLHNNWTFTTGWNGGCSKMLK